jgi:hypothetical protein
MRMRWRRDAMRYGESSEGALRQRRQQGKAATLAKRSGAKAPMIPVGGKRPTAADPDERDGASASMPPVR